MQCVISVCFIFFFKQKTAYEMRISDWSSDVCSSDLFGSRIRDIHTGDTRELPLPVYVVAPNGSYALSVDYRRLYITHETIGYSEHGGPFQVELCPADDGIRIMDLDTGADRKSVVSGKSVSVRVDLGGLRVINKKIQRRIEYLFEQKKRE